MLYSLVGLILLAGVDFFLAANSRLSKTGVLGCTCIFAENSHTDSIVEWENKRQARAD